LGGTGWRPLPLVRGGGVARGCRVEATARTGELVEKISWQIHDARPSRVCIPSRSVGVYALLWL
jgi:hypothetical protein